MAGGIWLSQNKKRPGAYINFKAVPRSLMTVGDRGIVAMGLPLSWGAEGKLIEVLSSDLIDGTSRKLVGFTAFDAESKLLAGALNYCYKALVYRMDAGGTKATATVGNLTATAKYNGTFGNKINIAVVADDTLYDIITYVDGAVVDSQKVSVVGDIDGNDYVDFSGTGALTATSGTPLTGGTDGTVTDATAYPALFALLKMAKWQVYACFSSENTYKANAITFIKQMRDDEGRYVQGVISNYATADYEGIINSVSSVVIDDVTFSITDFVAIVAGMTAGADINESNTARVVDSATKIVNPMTDTQIKAGLSAGQFIISESSSGRIKVEQDINSLHTFTSEKPYDFSKNRVIRALDEIGTTTKITWEDSYMGKVDNNDNGRAIFKTDLMKYGAELQRLSAIQNFDGVADINVAKGEAIDAVVAEWNVQPVDAMEKLYLNVNLRG